MSYESEMPGPPAAHRREFDFCVITDVPLGVSRPLGTVERHTAFVRELATRGSVHLLTIGFLPIGSSRDPRLQSNVSPGELGVAAATNLPRSTRVIERRNAAGRIARQLHFLFDPLPLFSQPRLGLRRLDDLCGRARCVVLLGSWRLAHLALSLPRHSRSLVSLDEAPERFPDEYFHADRSVRRRAAWWLERRKIQRLYQRLGQRASAAVALSEAEAAWFRRYIRGAPVVAIAHGIDLDYYRCADSSAARDIDVLVVGDLRGPRNAQGALDAFRAARGSDLRLRWAFVGIDPDQAIRDLAGPDVLVTGYVEDVRPYYERARVVLVPSTMVTGVKNSVLQGWAMRRPVVASAPSAASASAIHERDILIGKDPGELTACVNRILQTPLLAERLVEGGYGRIRREHDLRVVASAFAELADELAGRQ